MRNIFFFIEFSLKVETITSVSFLYIFIIFTSLLLDSLNTPYRPNEVKLVKMAVFFYRSIKVIKVRRYFFFKHPQRLANEVCWMLIFICIALVSIMFLSMGGGVYSILMLKCHIFFVGSSLYIYNIQVLIVLQ